ncbi:hypothetical protein DY000_02027827 [Brassica cretica]|uniref:Uncharacterized protein n=1 Tax=Brassica cretica TaxID=69181 RepID=A0ABQ7E5N7_BRACR|nr:hypothetical protein DY000_02027827 [Brassica cretica]
MFSDAGGAGARRRRLCQSFLATTPSLIHASILTRNACLPAMSKRVNTSKCVATPQDKIEYKTN